MKTTSESKFKVGDKIICHITEEYRNSHGVWYRNGEVYKVRSVMTGERYNVESKTEFDLLDSDKVWVLGRDFKLYEEAKEEWVDGIPQVGTVCEYSLDKINWYTCEVLFVGKSCIVAECQIDPDIEQYLYVENTYFRPIKKAEEIAAEEAEKKRDKVIKELTKFLSNQPCDDHYTAIALYDAGYRKVKSDE